MRDNAVELLFSLFTSADRAVAIAGDLAEERDQQGWFWFWLHVVRVTFALWHRAATDASLKALALVLAGLMLIVASAFGGIAAVFLVPQLMDSPLRWIVLPFFWWAGALFTGASLVALDSKSGMAACALLAVAVGALSAVWYDPSNAGVLFRTTGLITPLPLLMGAAFARRRLIIARPVLSQEQHQ